MPTATAPPLPPGRYVDLPGRGRTFARIAEGPPGAPTLLLLHGWTANADLNWFRCFGPLSRSFNVVAIDHRGHGRGIRSRRPFSLSDCADDAAALVGALGIGRVIAVGYSMGGPIAQLLWKRHPGLVDGLVLCATWGPEQSYVSRHVLRRPPERIEYLVDGSRSFVTVPSRDFGHSLGERALFTGLLGLSGLASITPDRLRRDIAHRIFGRRFEQSPLGAWMADELKRNDPTTILRAGWSIGRFSSAGWIATVDVPTTVVVTTQDSIVSIDRQRQLARSIPGAEVVEVAGDHGVCVTEPHRFVPALVAAATNVARRARAAPVS